MCIYIYIYESHTASALSFPPASPPFPPAFPPLLPPVLPPLSSLPAGIA